MYIVFFDDEEIQAFLMMYSVTCIAFCKCENIKYSCQRTSPHSIVTKKMYKKISSVHGSSVLTVNVLTELV